MTRQKLREMRRIEAHVSYISKWIIVASTTVLATVLTITARLGR